MVSHTALGYIHSNLQVLELNQRSKDSLQPLGDKIVTKIFLHY